MTSIGTRTLGDGLVVSSLGLGCIGMSQHYGAADRDESLATIARALELGITVASRIVQVRRKQDYFRRQLVGIEKECRITGIADLRFLRASHIRPWAACDTGTQRVDGNNGLLMAPQVDHLFDRGWISFEDSGRLLRSEELPEPIVKGLGLNLKKTGRYGSFTEAQRGYLDFHRTVIYDTKFRQAKDPVEDLLRVLAEA